ncbi:response regulator [Synoicihabitans lomoniglobus]|uniref:Response regulator transcription factor n=1 Tax=Synoicihabitans lomoniglobus TaxID=2909285 RepID=A0AAF0CQ31_9BACT|nr:response regulator transcription factor [Opitutaceae bacterium LMO-M01]WED65973.1 response regulator transcription factor [Opitutaceae bacterium LMO-M01]
MTVAPQPRTPGKIRLLVVDDHMVMRMGLVYAASAQPDMEVIAEVETGEEALLVYRDHHPDVVVLDLRMRGWGGLQTIRVLRQEFRDAKIVIYSNYARGEEVFQALKSGASGFVVKNMEVSRLLEAIRKVKSGGRYLPPELAVRMSERALSPLSDREHEVLALISTGQSNKEIGNALGVTEGTIKLHVTNIFSKLEVNSRTEALVVAVQRGIIDIEPKGV